MASIVDEIEYKLDNVPVTPVPADKIDGTFRSSTIDLISGTLGGKILAFSDQWFAEASNLLTPTPPISQPGKMVFTGAWYDGWETRRHNPEPFDWVIVRLGVASGTVEGVEVDTAFFNGNHAPAVSVEGCFSKNDDEVVSWKGGRGKWETILGVQEGGPSQRLGWKLNSPTGKRYTHVRLNMYPDGGIARFRLFGHAVPVFPQDTSAVFDLAAAVNGGVAVSCSDQHFGTKDNLLLPGRGKDMGDGWETKRSRGDHIDWAIIRLGAPGYIEKFVVDTAHFRGNFPQKVAVQGINHEGGGDPGADAEGWVEAVASSKTGPDREHEFESAASSKPFTHVKLIMIPDGGVKRLRAYAMDLGVSSADESEQRPRPLPDDLPKSLNDRRHASKESYVPDTELYDGWQGESQFLTTPALAKPLNFGNLSLNDYEYEKDTSNAPKDSDTRLMEMLAAQANHLSTELEDEQAIIDNETLSDSEKKDMLQKALHTAASNGDVDRLNKLLDGSAKDFVDVNAPDEDGTPPLIYASCFALIAKGADVNKQDRNQWSPLMWAMTNRHKGIAKALLDNGASGDQRTSSGRTAFDFVPPDSEMSYYLSSNGYSIGNAGMDDDFYNPGFGQDRFEEELAEMETRRRLMMESARDLEVDLGNVGMDDQPEPVEEFEEEQQEFDWSRCLHDQMFVFQEHELDHILDIVITKMTPQRSPSQKPVPANMIFLSARYAHYHSSPELLGRLLVSAMDRINDVVERCQWDMTILAFWISNATLLLHYLKKDAGLVEATVEFQAHLAELINEIFILIVRDAERRLDKVLDPAMLDHETIPGFEDITFQNEWKIFKRKTTVKEEPLEKRFRPPSPKQRAKPAPRSVTSLLSSTLFVLDLYDIHSVITAQIMSQLIYWISAELFNRIMSNRKYLARTKAMQIRMNISTLEEWVRTNNRQAEHYEAGNTEATGETTADAARQHLAPVIQLLQWLQCFSSLDPDDLEALIATLQQLKRLTPQQLIHAVNHYRPEVGEKGLPKSAMKYLLSLQKEAAMKRDRRRSRNMSPMPDTSPVTPVKGKRSNSAHLETPGSIQDTPGNDGHGGSDDDDDAPEHLLMDPAMMLPFTLPSVTDMLVSYGAGLGGVNRERERKYIPSVPPEFLEKLEVSGARKGPMFEEKDWENEEV
ncbi:Allantoicase [Emericellopsis cladophorae]|uniref:allantoicase n=1 Tax=Emericellopsis cladophorae TaxID=2686198 RepID=A0A9P9Y8C1_9HYPO|nr:Allantoicase [Emericellopsis cladophorae]KAI6785397.1 Allantoicase [Emericellopsis cladophorae]